MLALKTIYICVYTFLLTWLPFQQFCRGFFPSFFFFPFYKPQAWSTCKEISGTFCTSWKVNCTIYRPDCKAKPSAWPSGHHSNSNPVKPWPVMNHCLWYQECWQFNHSTVSIENSIYLKRWYCFPQMTVLTDGPKAPQTFEQGNRGAGWKLGFTQPAENDE